MKSTKILLSIFLAAIMVVVAAGPVLAADVTTGVTVGASTTPPYMVALTMTPDDTPGDGVQVDPEFAIPDMPGAVFPPVSATPTPKDSRNGWKLVKFYVEVGHTNGVENIDNVAIDVNYPPTFADPGDAILFAGREDTLKFEINARRSTAPDQYGVSDWTSEIVYPYDETYPDGTAANLPMMHVRQLVYAALPASPNYDMVDVNANKPPVALGDTPDEPWGPFLTTWGPLRIKYASGHDAASAFDLYQLGQAIVLEIKCYIWYHQPGDHYTVEAKAATANGATSAVLNGGGKFLHFNRVFGLFLDFDTVAYADVSVGEASWAPGDRFLTTSDMTTIWNNGNASAQVLVDSTKMVKDFTGTTVAELEAHINYDSAAKTIVTFDAKLYYTNGEGIVQQLGEIVYDASDAAQVIAVDATPASGEFGPCGPVLLQACRPAKIEFSVHPEEGEGQEQGNYKGFLTISVEAYTNAANQQVTQ